MDRSARSPRPAFRGNQAVLLLPAAVLLAAILWVLLRQRQMLSRLARQTEAVRLSEERLTLVLAGSEDGFWDWDLRSGRIDRSERWALDARLHPGGDRADVRGRPQPGPSGRSRPPGCPLSPSGKNPSGRHHSEYRMRTKGGDWRWILDRGKVVARRRGRPARPPGRNPYGHHGPEARPGEPRPPGGPVPLHLRARAGRAILGPAPGRAEAAWSIRPTSASPASAPPAPTTPPTTSPPLCRRTGRRRTLMGAALPREIDQLFAGEALRPPRRRGGLGDALHASLPRSGDRRGPGDHHPGGSHRSETGSRRAPDASSRKCSRPRT